MNDGYTIEEIEASDIYNKMNSVDWKGVVGDSILTTAKEYIIKYVMQEVLGANATFSRMFAQFMANVNPLDLLKPFLSFLHLQWLSIKSIRIKLILI